MDTLATDQEAVTYIMTQILKSYIATARLPLERLRMSSLGASASSASCSILDIIGFNQG
jgi:hypothetical protein